VDAGVSVAGGESMLGFLIDLLMEIYALEKIRRKLNLGLATTNQIIKLHLRINFGML